MSGVLSCKNSTPLPFHSSLDGTPYFSSKDSFMETTAATFSVSINCCKKTMQIHSTTAHILTSGTRCLHGSAPNMMVSSNREYHFLKASLSRAMLYANVGRKVTFPNMTAKDLDSNDARLSNCHTCISMFPKECY